MNTDRNKIHGAKSCPSQNCWIEPTRCPNALACSDRASIFDGGSLIIAQDVTPSPVTMRFPQSSYLHFCFLHWHVVTRAQTYSVLLSISFPVNIIHTTFQVLNATTKNLHVPPLLAGTQVRKGESHLGAPVTRKSRKKQKIYVGLMTLSKVCGIRRFADKPEMNPLDGNTFSLRGRSLQENLPPRSRKFIVCATVQRCATTRPWETKTRR